MNFTNKTATGFAYGGYLGLDYKFSRKWGLKVDVGHNRVDPGPQGFHQLNAGVTYHFGNN